MLRAARLVAALTVAAAASGASAATPRSSASPAGQAARAVALAAQHAHELRLFARDTGMTLAEAAAYYEAGALADAVETRARARYGASFAGVWRDPGDRAQPVHVAFVGDAAAKAAEVTAGLDATLVRAVHADLTLGELHALTARVTRDIDAWAARGVRISQVTENVQGNDVVVTVPGLTPSQASAIARAYGASVRAEDGTPVHPAAGDLATCFDRSRCANTLRGGLRSVGTSQHQCTTGFTARKGTAPQMLTAGHCFVTGENVTHAGVPVGAVGGRRYSGSVDGEYFPIQPQPVWNDMNWVYFDDTTTEYYVEQVAGRTVRESLGAPVCRSGITTGVRCGTIRSLNATILQTDTVLFSQRVASGCALPGDSGGPVVYDATAYGVVSGSNFVRDAAGSAACNKTPTFTYSGLVTTENTLGIRVRTS